MNRQRPFVSVVIPTYDRCETLRKTIGSLLDQSYPKGSYEVIVIDNSSSDGTDRMVLSLQKEAPCPLKYVRIANQGPGVARNLGISEAVGDVVAFTDSDCIADSKWIESGLAGFSDGVGIVQGTTLPNPDQALSMFSKTQRITKENGYYETCNIFYLKEALAQVGGFSEDFIGLDRFGNPMWGGEDTDLAWRVKKCGYRSVFSEDAIVYHHIFHVTLWKEVFSYYKCHVFYYVCPNLIKKHPELRGIILYRHLFINKNKALFDLFFLSLILGVLAHPLFLLLTIPYASFRIKGVFKGRALKTYHRGIVAVAVYFMNDAIASVLLAMGSLRYRTMIL